MSDFRFVGRISYSLYLWHWPMLIFLRYPWCGRPADCPAYVPVLASGISLAVAAVSYWIVELPFRKKAVSTWATICRGLATSALLSAAGLAIHVFQGIPDRLPAVVARYAEGTSDVSPLRNATIGLTASAVRAGHRAIIGAPDNCKEPLLLLWGDSHADMYVPVLDASARAAGISSVSSQKV